MKSTYQYFGIPEALSVGFVALCVILLLSPYAAGSDWGIFRIPEFGQRAKNKLKWVGPLLLIIALVGFIPIIRTGTSNTGGKYIRGPLGGCYYISSSGKKVYVDRSLCD